MKSNFLILLSFSLLLFFSCKVKYTKSNFEIIESIGPKVNKDISVDMYRYIEIDVNATIEIIQSDSLNIHVEGAQNIIENLYVSVSNSHLTIKLKKANCKSEDLHIKLFVPSIQKVVLNGGGRFFMNEWKNEERLHFENNGSAEYHVGKLHHVKNISIEINGSGSFLATDNSENIHHLTCELNGSGDVNIEKYSLLNASVEINGSGNVELGNTEHLRAEIVGSGNVTYLGTPKIHQEVVGSGTIHQK